MTNRGLGQVSNDVTFALSAQTSNGTLFLNNHASSVFVVTFASLFNRSANSGDLAQLELFPQACTFHAGSVGAGFGDRFPLTCEVAVVLNASVQLVVVAGAWDALVTGYWTPANI